MSLAGKIHELCNGVQFMKVEAAVLLDAFNNPRPNMIKVCSGEKYRVQHLLYQVKMYLDNNNQPKELFEPICNAFGIKASDCVRRKNLENDHWGKNKDFIKEVKAIFEDEF